MSRWQDSPEILAGIFDNANAARQAIAELQAKGFAADQIGLLTPPAKGQLDAIQEESGTEVATGATVGAAAGAGLGIGWGIAVATGVLPIVGPVVAGGIMTSVLIGALGGGTIGALAGALAPFGLSETVVKHYLHDLAKGRTVVLVDAGDRYPDAAAVLARFGGDTRSQAIPDSGEVLPEHVRGKSP